MPEIVLCPGLWRGFDCLVEPPTPAHRMRHFGEHGEALEFAEELGRDTGWPVIDRSGG